MRHIHVKSSNIKIIQTQSSVWRRFSQNKLTESPKYNEEYVRAKQSILEACEKNSKNFWLPKMNGEQI